MTEALPVALQQLGKSSSEGQLCPVPMSMERAQTDRVCALELIRLHCYQFAKQDSPTSVCHAKHNFGRLEIYGMAGLADEGLDRRTLALKALSNFLA